MSELFAQYKADRKFAHAMIVAQNEFNRNPESLESFKQYFSFLCELGQTETNLEEREDYIRRAEAALTFYQENAALSETVVNQILEYQTVLDEVAEHLFAEREERYQKAVAAAEADNNVLLKQLFDLLDSIREAKTREEFDRALCQVKSLDDKLDKDIFTQDQIQTYDTLTRAHTDTVSNKMRELERAENISYNNEAVASFYSAFKKFKENEGQYVKNEEKLKELACSFLFPFDTGRLFSETLIYYNHVYGYIFSKLNDDGKLKLTKLSVECERKKR